MNNHYTYFLILGLSFAGPLLLSFDKKVAFYKEWKYLLPASLLPAAFYIAWDMFFTYKGVWNFNPDYIQGTHLGYLPIEEVLFFFIVPYCCVFIYACIKAYFPKIKRNKNSDTVLMTLAIFLFIAGIFNISRWYTASTFLLSALFIFFVLRQKKFFKSFDSARFMVSYAVCLIPFFVVNGFLTAIPVVNYNDAENLGIRIYTIPFEDTFYGMLLIMMNIAGYEKLKSRR
ncbi:MAG: lycopene cyclase domain-containing protein [Ferruginibacter sp.]|nr:lycopene cyclase domain-containing protein [Ferruginibacter sp.]